MVLRRISKNALLIILGIAVILGFAACTPAPEEEFDEEALLKVMAYTSEMAAALDSDMLKADLMGWIREPEREELPFVYDEERITWLMQERQDLEALQNKHLQDDFPQNEEIAAWQVTLVQEGEEWLLEGGAVLEALGQLNELFGEVTGTIDTIEKSGGVLDAAQSEAVLELLEGLEERAAAAGAVFHR